MGLFAVRRSFGHRSEQGGDRDTAAHGCDATAAKGRVAVFSRKTSGCPGGGTGLGTSAGPDVCHHGQLAVSGKDIHFGPL
ncbi:MAG: DUF169 domain-containing protein [Gammaproteobacteria bacterium]